MNSAAHRNPSGLTLLFFVVSLMLTPVSRAANVRVLSLTQFDDFTRSTNVTSGQWVLRSPWLGPGFAWNELILSWNCGTNVSLTLQARPDLQPEADFYTLAHWVRSPGVEQLRTSVKGQKDARAEVQTDTLVLRGTADRAQLLLVGRGPLDELKRVTLTFSGPSLTNSPTNPGAHSAWGREWTVPIRTQAEYPEGVDKWCSPASTAMLLAFWARENARPELEVDVPEVAAGVFDPGWGGTGNWPFNMAYAGMAQGLNSAVGRFRGLDDLEAWVGSGLPAAVSLSYAMLKGKPEAAPGDGHLVVVRGFTETGEIIINDPGVRRERVRRIFPREDFDRAWAHSGRTVYLVWPDGQRLPSGPVFPR